MNLGQLMSTSWVLSKIPCIIPHNWRNVAPFSGLVNKSAYISPIGNYFRENSPLLIHSFIKKYYNWMCFFLFMIYSLPLVFMSTSLVLSWWYLSSSNAYPCPSTKYLNHRHCGKVSSSTTISSSVELLPFVFLLSR